MPNIIKGDEKKIQITIRLKKWIIRELKQMSNYNSYIEDLIVKDGIIKKNGEK